MVTIICYSEDNPDRIYEYCLSFILALVFAALFSIVTMVHAVQAVRYRKPFAWVVIMAGAWELGGYVTRTLSVLRQFDSGLYSTQFLLILLAPLWTNAFIYMTTGRMIHFFLEHDRIYGIRSRRIALIFVLFDITAFLIQLAGGLLASGTTYTAETIQNGLRIYSAGVGLQLIFIAVFAAIAIGFQRALKAQDQRSIPCIGLEASQTQYQPSGAGRLFEDNVFVNRKLRDARPLLVTVWIALTFIILRNIYRLVEYALGGIRGNVLTHHKWYLYAFDATPMLLAIFALNVYHPGKVLQGARMDFTEETQARKAEKVARKEAKKEMRRQGKGYSRLEEHGGDPQSRQALVSS